MAKYPPATIELKDMSEENVAGTLYFLNRLKNSDGIPDGCNTKDFHSDIIRDHLHHQHVERRRISCVLSVKPALCNSYGFLHGGSVAAAADFISTACARTVVAEDKDIFLGELSICYLSGAPKDTQVAIDASIIRSGRNLTIVAVEFRLQKTGKLLYTTRSTFYNLPVAKL